MYNRLLFKDEGRAELIKGVNKLVDAVKVTLGGNGKNVIILNKLSHPHVTKDGVTVAKSIMLRNDVQQGGVEVVRQASIKAANETGDGTTTATVLAGSMINKGASLLDSVNIQSFREGMEQAGKDIEEQLTKLSENVGEDVNKLIDIATISANGDRKIGEIVGKSIFEVGAEGSYSVTEGKNTELGITFEKMDGYSFKRNLTPLFETSKGSGKCYLENPKVLILNCYLGNISALEDVYEDGEDLVVFYKDVDGVLLHNVAVSFASGRSRVVLCQLPDFGDTQEQSVLDLRDGLGATVISDLKQMLPQESHLGEAKSFEADGSTVKILFKPEFKEIVDERAKNVKESLDNAKEDDKWMYEERYHRLSNGVGTFKISAQTDIDFKEIKDKVDDTIGSVVSAMEEGIVTGGGIALLQAIHQIPVIHFEDKSFEQGYNVVIDACFEPFKQIIYNCGIKDETEFLSLLEDIQNSDFKKGYNAKTKRLSNLKEEGIIDATKVTKVSLRSAISASIGLLTTDCIIYPEDNEI